MEVRKVLGALVATMAVAVIATVGGAGATERREPTTTCAYDSATGVVTFSFAADADPNSFDIAQPYIDRDGERIVFKADYQTPLACTGGSPTVHNTDRIDLTSTGRVDVLLTLVLKHGPLAPGATPEPSKPEIEIDSTVPKIEIEITPSERSEKYTFGQTASGPGANLNAGEKSADADIVLHGVKRPRRHNDFIFTVANYGADTNHGDDVYSAAGGPGFDGPFPYNVLLVGGVGRDRLTGGLGNDTIYGGEGSDILRGGQGGDRINSLGAQRDVVDCGPGRDRAEATDRDRVHHCEVIAHSN